ncbi:NADH kinase, mitochondrial precursor, putative [Candida dubliniensis CD36]|uniref:NADH kinase, mitochondrial, putative n=1 Tax=Candida dubliniensis (strain CD36 / ATCC MYA-646 / CBS 7987 / NCPF 3949 / NRRL Y-17841) TaxID=573826 RepID=B9WES7_CANDC|nr:NADH kinase, mitochondrial precursor, putative [Candida dubliniensis CD36]CAX43189.1 NADH kinase, mitochondrial precursor, putative [Candida dubliniensis CD36]
MFKIQFLFRPCLVNNHHQTNISRLIHFNSLHTITKSTPLSSKLIIGKAQLSLSTTPEKAQPKMALTVQSCTQLPTGKLPEYIKSSKSRLYNIVWSSSSPPTNIYIAKKPGDASVREAMIEFINHLHQQYPSINVIVNQEVADELMHELKTTTTIKQNSSSSISSSTSVSGKSIQELMDPLTDHVIYTGKNEDIVDKTELMITLGGDGTILHGVSLFSNVVVPPILSFAMGTLGFLLPFDFKNYKQTFREVYEGRSKALHRNRLECHVIRKQIVKTLDDGERANKKLKTNGEKSISKLKEEQSSSSNGSRKIKEMIHAMNDVTIHRGSSPNLTSLDIYIDNEFFTTTFADGVIFATPTGSTAYSLSSGGSITHPSVPCVLLTPICPRSLSFRPLILPSSSDIMIRLSESNRNQRIELTIDGITQPDLHPGDEVHITSEVAITSGGQSLLSSTGGGNKTTSTSTSAGTSSGSSGSSTSSSPSGSGNNTSGSYGDKNGIWCVATNQNQWSKDLNSLLGFNSSFRDQKGKRLHL